jgi:hypothetical protein
VYNIYNCVKEVFVFFLSANLSYDGLWLRPHFYVPVKFQDPAEADKLLKIQRELDETKIILVSIKHARLYITK